MIPEKQINGEVSKWRVLLKFIWSGKQIRNIEILALTIDI